MNPAHDKQALRPESPSPRSRADTAPNRSADGIAQRDGLHLTLEGHGSPRERLVQTLLASIRHELRSPLQSIQGFAELLDAGTYGALSSDQRTFVNHILQGSIELASALDACFDLAQLELSGGRPELVVVDVRQALKDALRQHAPEEGQIRCRFEPRASVGAELDTSVFRRAIRALLVALAPFTPLEISLQRQASQIVIGVDPQQPHGEELPPLDTDVETLASLGRPARALLWMRLASLLLASLGGSLRVSQALDRVQIVLPAA